MIQAHIHKLLFDYDCVIIPDFGGLITHYEAARIHPVKHTFLPPSKRVAFNEKLKLNDGLLISTFAYDKRLSTEEAQQQVATFVHQLQEELYKTQRYELKGIGIFRLNAEQKIEFEYIPSDNFLNDSFGLPELMARPVITADATAGLRTLLKEKQAESAVSTAKPTLRRKVRRLYNRVAVFAITGLTVSVLYFITQQTQYSLSSLNPFALFGNSTSTSDEILNKSTDLEKSFAAEAYKAEERKTITLSGPEIKDEPAIPAELPRKTTSELSELKTAPAKVLEKAPDAIKSEKASKAIIKKPVVAVAAIKKEENKKSVVLPVKAKNAPAFTINGHTGRYYIISGGYSTLKNAELNRKKVMRHGKNGKIILPFKDSKLYRVSLADYALREEALQDLPVLRKKFGPNIWILNY